MDFKGTWKCRNGFQAYIKELKDGLWWGTRDYTGFNTVGMHVMPGEFKWNSEGKDFDDNEEWDLMERLSDRWSKERSGGEGG